MTAGRDVEGKWLVKSGQETTSNQMKDQLIRLQERKMMEGVYPLNEVV